MGWCIWRPAHLLRANPLCAAKSGQMQEFLRPRRTFALPDLIEAAVRRRSQLHGLSLGKRLDD